MAKVLITGASGFVGSHLAEALVARGDEVSCLVRRTSRTDRLRALGVDLAVGDVTDAASLGAAVAPAHTVYHVAGCIRWLHAARLFEINEQGVRNVAGACARQGTPPVLVIVSSLAAAGPAPNGRLRTEADPPAPVSEYGRSKRAGERAAERFAERVPITVVRPPIILGERDTLGVAMFRSIARFGIHTVPGRGRARYSLIHARDLAELLILAAERGRRLQPQRADRGWASAGYYFAACREHPSYVELGRMVGVAVGVRRVVVVRTPPRAVWCVAAVNEIAARFRRRPPYLSFDKAREIRAGSWLCSPRRAADELGFAEAAPLADRLRQTAQWYREQGWL